MKQPVLLGLCLIAIATQSSCSCGIYYEVYGPQPSNRRLTDDLVAKVARANGFVPKSANSSPRSFSKRDVDLFYSDPKQTVTLHSSYCPLIPFKMDPGPWEVRCDESTSQVVDAFKVAGVPLKKLRLEESQGRGEQGANAGVR